MGGSTGSLHTPERVPGDIRRLRRHKAFSPFPLPETPSDPGRAASGKVSKRSLPVPLPRTHKALRPGSSRLGAGGPGGVHSLEQSAVWSHGTREKVHLSHHSKALLPSSLAPTVKIKCGEGAVRMSAVWLEQDPGFAAWQALPPQAGLEGVGVGMGELCNAIGCSSSP